MCTDSSCKIIIIVYIDNLNQIKNEPLIYLFISALNDLSSEIKNYDGLCHFKIKGKLSDSFTNYNYVGNTKVSVSIKKT